MGGLLVVGAAWWITRSPIFDLRSLQVSGTSHLSAEDVAGLGRLDGGTNVLWLSTSALQQRLLADPWIASVHIERTLPSGVSIRVRERVPIAVAEPGSWLVAADGTVLGPANRDAALPTITPGPRLRPGARLSMTRVQLRVARSLPAPLRRNVATISTHPAEQVILVLRGGGRIILGDPTDLISKASAILGVLRWAESTGVAVGTIDVRAPEAPALLPYAPTSAISPGPGG